MIENYFCHPFVLSRLRNGPMAPYLSGLIRTLEEQGFQRHPIRWSVRMADALGQWLRQEGIPLAEANGSHAKAFVMQRSRTSFGRLRASGVPRIVRALQGQGILNAPEAHTESDRWLQRFDEHLAQVHGLCRDGRENYLRYARRFLASRPDGTVPDWTGLKADEIQSFVRIEMAKLAPTPSRRQPISAMRAMIRFLAAEGSVSPNLAKAIPVIRDWKHATLPKHFSVEQLDRVLTLCRNDSTLRFRDRAMVLLMARLGMRSCEVRQLQLEDIDWAAGVIRVHLSKARYERSLPLPEDAGAAIVSYLRTERPPSSNRTVFLRVCAPYAPMSGVAEVTRRILEKAEITGARVGAHHFRHTAATHMVRQGASFKEVADVLGHRSLETTAIYAKLDAHCLAQVALPWPGGAQ
jgi:site-specific recombinase XerD